MKLRLVKTHTKSEVELRNQVNRASPILFVRFAKVKVYRHAPWDFLGLFDKEVANWSEWQESKNTLGQA